METLIELEGAPTSDGTTEWFTLLGDGKGNRGVHLGTEVDGAFDDEPTESIWNSHAYQIGSTFGGIRINHRDVLFKAHIKKTSDASWETNDSEWRKAWNYKKDSKLWVQTETSRRHLPLRPFETPVAKPEFDPHGQEFGTIDMHCRAGKPRWLEPDVTKEWISNTDTLDGSWNTGTIPVWNPTDTEIWLKWTVQAYPGAIYRLPDYSFGDDRYEMADEHATRQIVMPELLAGEHLKVNTDEEDEQVASSIDTQVWLRMNGVTFLYPVPPYQKTKKYLPVSVKNAPAGVGVQVRMPRTWTRPWGLQ
ncbi:phage tail protein [Rhodococcus sp. NPDC019627]|uniref:phage tail protein n=1 Tax=unclassified Rhodococcus (in: high G+C Gram-positive bacteria) TaxID=192944 RepID=UPI003404A1E6